jgi:hypothetical protein
MLIGLDSLMNLFHLLSAGQIEIPLLFNASEGQSAEQMLDPGRILQGLHKQKMEVLSRIVGSEELPFKEKLIVASEGFTGEVAPVFEILLCLGFGDHGGIFGRLFCRDSEIPGQLPGSRCVGDSQKPGRESDHISGGTAAEAVEIVIHFHTGVVVIVERADCHAVGIDRDSEVFSSLPGSDGLLDVRVVDQMGITSFNSVLKAV